eukprot:gnl/Hemi2/11064_TR3806_c0_g1_i1.p2 gnl/Hemi2/11064_TR3806_c0_g1~~gnl/Hemi2/11064_TR3806_c0_g1_i1.p2  ORF type:complete len:120 (+),score=35.96 gnl/Hemi2/11064_TR3806_c0_g1_i1:209-568(+)
MATSRNVGQFGEPVGQWDDVADDGGDAMRKLVAAQKAVTRTIPIHKPKKKDAYDVEYDTGKVKKVKAKPLPPKPGKDNSTNQFQKVLDDTKSGKRKRWVEDKKRGTTGGKFKRPKPSFE